MEDSTEKRLLVSQQLGLYPSSIVRLWCVSVYVLDTVLSNCSVVASVAEMEGGSRLTLFVTLHGNSKSIVACPCVATPQV